MLLIAATFVLSGFAALIYQVVCGGCLTAGPAGGFVGSCLGSVLTGFVFLEHLIWVS